MGESRTPEEDQGTAGRATDGEDMMEKADIDVCRDGVGCCLEGFRGVWFGLVGVATFDFGDGVGALRGLGDLETRGETLRGDGVAVGEDDVGGPDDITDDRVTDGGIEGLVGVVIFF